MAFLRKLVKWVAILVVVLAVGLLILVWPILGVSPIEGSAAHLWELVSTDVDFYVRFPGTRLLQSDLAERLADRSGFEPLADWRDRIAELSADVARQVNPQIPLGLFEVDLKRDILEREMAFAGWMRTDFSQARFDNFLILLRVPWYGRFLSALKRGFVRDRVPDGDRIAVVSGLYLRIKLDPETAKSLAAFRSVTGREEDDDVLYVGRIKDVVLISDTPEWIEAPLRGRSDTLRADPWFETEYRPRSEEGENVEVFVRPRLSGNLMIQHGREDTGGPLLGVRKLLPVPMTGEVTVIARPEPDGLDIRIANNPQQDGFARVKKQHLIHLYEREKADLHHALGENGIGRFIPRRRTVAAAVLQLDAEDLLGLVLDFIPRDELELVEDEVRKAGYRRGFEALLRDEIFESLGDTHLLIVQRPSLFETADLTRFKDPPEVWPGIPPGQFGFTVVSRLKDSVTPDSLRAKIFKILRYVRLNAMGTNAKWGFARAELMDEPPDLRLVKPAYGPLPEGLRYFVFSTSEEGAAAVFEAASDPDERLISESSVRRAVRRLTGKGSMAGLVMGEPLRLAMADHVRSWAAPRLGMDAFARQRKAELMRRGLKEPELSRVLKSDKEQEVRARYPELREQYLEQLSWLGAVDCMAISATLGIGPTRKAEAHVYVRAAGPESAVE